MGCVEKVAISKGLQRQGAPYHDERSLATTTSSPSISISSHSCNDQILYIKLRVPQLMLFSSTRRSNYSPVTSFATMSLAVSALQPQLRREHRFGFVRRLLIVSVQPPPYGGILRLQTHPDMQQEHSPASMTECDHLIPACETRARKRIPGSPAGMNCDRYSSPPSCRQTAEHISRE